VIKGLEVLGGVLLIIPRTRVLGLILIGAILFNIAAIHQFFFGGLKDPTVIGLIVLAVIVTSPPRPAVAAAATSKPSRPPESAPDLGGFFVGVEGGIATRAVLVARLSLVRRRANQGRGTIHRALLLQRARRSHAPTFGRPAAA
jgi:hypothetical protein